MELLNRSSSQLLELTAQGSNHGNSIFFSFVLLFYCLWYFGAKDMLYLIACTLTMQPYAYISVFAHCLLFALTITGMQ